MTSDQVKAKFQRDGKTFAGWARDNGFSRHSVYLVLNGQYKGKYGKAHEIATKLGLKPAVQTTTSH